MDCCEIGGRIPKRYITVMVCFLGLMTIQQMRSTLSVTITQMVKPIPKNETQKMDISICRKPQAELNAFFQANKSVSDSKSSSEPFSNPSSEPSSKQTQFEWSQELQGFILASFYYGYALFEIPSGMLVQRFGAKLVFLFAIWLTAIVSLVTPTAVEWGGAAAMITLRVLMGVFQSGATPAMAALIAVWVPVTERSLLSAIAYSGSSTGVVVGTYVSGLLLAYFKGWHSVFYVFGAAGLFSSIILVVFCDNTPEECTCLRERERKYLDNDSTTSRLNSKLPPTPWKQILTSPPVLALIVTQICHDFAVYVILSHLPKYMNDVLQISIKDNGFYSSVPQVAKFFFTYICAFCSDWIISTNSLSITNTRKLFVLIASIFPAIFIVTASYAGCNELLVVASFAISVGSQGAKIISANINSMDLSPNYAAILVSIVVSIGSLTGMIAPVVVGWMTPNSLLIEWRNVFWLACGLHILKAIVYTIWGSGKVQSFNSRQETSNTEDSHELGKLVLRNS